MAEPTADEVADGTGAAGGGRTHRMGWPQPRQLVKPLVILAVSLVVGWVIVRLVGAVDWAAVGHALSHLNAIEIPVLITVLLVRQSLNAVPLTQFLPGLSWWRSLQNDLTALLVGTVAPPPADVVVRVSMFRSWGFDPVDGMAGVTLNMLAFYSVRFLAPVLGLMVLSVHGFETGQLVTAVLCAAVAAAILVGLLLVVRGDGLASLVGQVAGRVVKRFRATVDPLAWADSVVAFRGRMAGNVRAGLGRSMVALMAMVLADGTVLLLSLRFVGLGMSDLTVDQVIGLFLLAYPLTLLPMSGLGVLDALLVAGFTDLCGVDLEPEIVAGLVVWRTVTIVGPLLLGVGTLGWWRHQNPRARAAG